MSQFRSKQTLINYLKQRKGVYCTISCLNMTFKYRLRNGILEAKNTKRNFKYFESTISLKELFAKKPTKTDPLYG